MLQRAAKNAYSWWWASHIRTKQSKWLDQNIHDMEEKVDYILKIIDEDGDSFARRAEMYYRKRPELLNFVEDTFRNYRALAERYDHLSRDLQTANRTIASVYPERVQMSMFDEDGEGFLEADSGVPPKLGGNNLPAAPNLTIPKILSIMKKKNDKPSKVMTKKGLLKFNSDDDANANSNSISGSGLSKDEALLEIDKLQKQILGVQTEREFVKSSYERQIAKYWEFENQVAEMQAKVNSLQDEFGIGTNIEDNEARSLMTCTALKSCQETLARLQEQKEQSNEAAKTESQKVQNAKLKFESLVKILTANQSFKHNNISLNLNVEPKKLEQKMESSVQGKNDLEESLKIKEDSEFSLSSFITVSEMAEKVDEAVEKVISLEISASSQNAYINRLKTEADELLVQLNKVEEEKETLLKDSENAGKKIRELEEKLQRVMNLEETINNQSNNLQTHISEAGSTLDELSGKLQNVQQDEEVDDSSSPSSETASISDIDSQKQRDWDFPTSPEMRDQNTELSGKRDTEYDTTFRSPDVNFSDILTKDPPSTINDNENIFSSPPKGLKSRARVTFADSISAVLGGSAETGKKQQKDDFPEQGTSLTKSKQADTISDILGDEVTGEKFKKDGNPDQDTKPTNKEHTKSISDISGDEVTGEKLKKGSGYPDQENLQDPRTRGEGEEPGIECDQPNWRELFVNCLDEREKVLLEEYITALRNYKEAKKKLNDAEKKRRASHFQYVIQIKVLKSSIASKDAEIQSLKKKLSSVQANHVETLQPNETLTKSSSDTMGDKSLDVYMKTLLQLVDVPTSYETPVREEAKPSEETKMSTTKGNKEVDVKITNLDEPQTFSTIEDKIRMDIDELLEENIEFWLRFSTSLHQMKKFHTSVEDLQAELQKIREKNKQEGSVRDKNKQEGSVRDKNKQEGSVRDKNKQEGSVRDKNKQEGSVRDKNKQEGSVRDKNKQEGSCKSPTLLSDIRPIYRHMKEIQTELMLWLEHSAVLKEDLKNRFSSLTNIQDEVARLSMAGTEEEEIQLSAVEAAKFQGEILNMKQENNKVAHELQTGTERVEKLQAEVKTTLSKLEKELGIKRERATTDSKIPVTSFLFGMKLRKQMPANILARVSPVIMQKRIDVPSLK